jgi:di/tricarboxylate transporter
MLREGFHHIRGNALMALSFIRRSFPVGLGLFLVGALGLSACRRLSKKGQRMRVWHMPDKKRHKAGIFFPILPEVRDGKRLSC